MRGDLSEMEAMIGEILEAARLDSANGRLHLADFDLRALTEDVLRLFQGRAPGVTLAPGASPRVRVDADRVRKVVANLIDNALKYSRDQARPVEVEIRAGNTEVTLSVRDHGAGIPEEDLPRLFEPFYRVDRSRSRDTGGYGLGLSLCKRIMEAHGGSIAVTSGRGAGAVATLVFPISVLS
jgi:signal transduction histidine kinase